MQCFRLFVFIVATTIGARAMQGDDDAIRQMRDRLKPWAETRASLDQEWVVTCTMQLPSSSVTLNRRLIRKAGDELYSSALDYERDQKRSKYVTIANPDYVASLEQAPNGEFVLTSLAVRGETANAELFESITGSDLFLTQVLDPGAVFLDLLLSNAVADVSVTSLPDGIESYDVTLNAAETPTGVVYDFVRIDFRNDRVLPVRLDSRHRQGGNDREVSLMSGDFITVGDFEFPKVVTIFTNGFFREGATPISISTFDYSRMFAGFDDRECYLTHFGIPEPAGAAKSAFPMWGLLAAVLIAAGFLMRRFSRSR
jgi:hypothetical protein